MENNVPQLRFPEFKDQWSKLFIKDKFNLISGQHLNPDEYTNEKNNGSLPYFTGPSDFTNNKDCVTKWNIKKGKVAKEGDILITVKGSGVGTHMFLKLKEVTMGRQLMAINPLDASSRFLYHKLFSFKNHYLALASGNMIPGLSRDDILKTKVYFPTTDEQTKIANFLTSVDKRINLLQKKKIELEQYKKGVMQKLFSQTIRFKDDNGNDFPDWKRKKLGEICEIKKGQQLNKEELTDRGSFPAINGGIEPSGYTEEWNTPENTITISEGGNSCGYINFIKTNFWSGGHCYSLLKLNNVVDNVFLYQSLKFNEHRIMRLRVGSGLPNIQKGDINNFKLLIPSTDEQKKIANFLLSIDKSIEKVGQQIEESVTFKKGLLQKMFV
ncbi:restriction endonuclease subunit S [Carboxylicivirga sp. A043]|uniref:restriction endonuclease subunit S n=1 Tax=Carboxylicivirga litoralis TaxID=2816963 RepID=UPI0021CB0C57|nr:restriction endonuclease subunit S [Carboxylicivirga sp. A043]MCU4155230.1 restriction endonuclease subunit S [Carboxylicivirga sp. A043]